MKMTLYNISNLDTLFQTLRRCRGSVTIELPGGASFDLRKHADMVQSFARAFSGRGVDRLDLRFSDARDIAPLLTHALNAVPC